ncbi:signal recognition particle-docking protein FtsY [Roseiconus lacunae]|uniref:signal recognition particle-docking protein FtsY n=1 Tax=Roseiconus lacunae TaxID=2605694 RepID=UPI001E41D667|nr:signal recognition particle-docking protein FtsY [Roseiconus lacunae]MCD0461470.1 signal recognition particle-docking protein FtsY [Roseiconus lacunae]WRQ52952.1 signal recognition particle-docking protein FtsY [Stieleria sp. HD01]
MAFWRSKKKSDDSSTSNTPGDSNSAPSDDSPETADTGGLFGRFRSGLEKTRRTLNTDIRDLFKDEGRLVDDEFLGELFAKLIRTDMGAGPAEELRDEVAKQYRGRKVQLNDVIESITEQTRTMLRQDEAPLNLGDPPSVILVVGVNGSGKTTSIGKVAHFLTTSGKKVVLGAGDTFRAAAVQQLTIWSERIGCDIVTGKQGADPASVAFQTVDKALQSGADVAIIDTAGRLQTQSNLMQELEKIRRVVEKKLGREPDEVLLVLDATAGQNALSQAKGFSEAAGCTGIVLAKLDGSARGGVILPIRRQFSLPVKFVGLGEGIEDIAKFDADSFAKALFAD